VIVMDIQMPGMNGIEGVRSIKARYPLARILMQTVFEDDDNVFDAICAGASGYILKTAHANDMMQAIRDVHAGGSAMSPPIAFKVLELFRANAPSGRDTHDPGLSDREKSVLTLLVKGRSYKMIADDLGISYHTVDSHIRRIYEKLHVGSGTEAVSRAIKDRLV
jgi:DNA-binding NarL/FixJ family response regulator